MLKSGPYKGRFFLLSQFTTIFLINLLMLNLTSIFLHIQQSKLSAFFLLIAITSAFKGDSINFEKVLKLEIT